jgi:type IV pilus assembly protein PilM
VAEEQRAAADANATEAVESAPQPGAGVDADVWNVVESGIREISGEVRNSLDFHRSQDGGGEVAQVVLSGRAEQIPGFADSLSLALGVEVVSRSVVVADERLAEIVSPHRLAVAAGLATTEAPA